MESTGEGWFNAHGTVVTLTVIITAVVFCVSAGHVVAQEKGLKEVSGSAADNDINLIPRTETGEDVSMEVGETLVIGFGAREENSEDVAIAENTDKFYWRIHEASDGNTDSSQLLYTTPGDIPDVTDGPFPRAAPVERVTSFRPTEPGDYVIEVETPNLETFEDDSPGGPYKGHTAEINVKPSDDLEKLRRYAPVLNFHPDEEYYPTRIEAIFDNSYLCASKTGAPDLPVRKMATLKNLPDGENFLNSYLQPYPVPSQSQINKCGRTALTLPGGFPADSLEEIDPTNSVYPKNVYGTVIKPSERDGDDLTFDPGFIHSSEYEDRGFEPPSDGGSYTALVYFMTYVNDPKPKNAREGEIFDEAAAHTGDIEPVWILLDNGEPEWLLAQQHKGGEYRKWENVEKTEDGHPIIYPGEGTHGNFLSMKGDDEPEFEVRNIEDTQSLPLDNPEDYPQYVYQQQYLCPSIACGDDFSIPRWDTTIATSIPGVDVGDIDGYIDVAAFAKSESGRIGKLWRPEGSDVSGISSDAEKYEISVLTGDETWSNYQGSVYRYPLLEKVGGDVHHQTTTWKEPGGRAEKFLFPDVAQIDAIFSDSSTQFDIPGDIGDAPEEDENIQEDIVLPDGRNLECGDYVDIPGTCDDVEAPPPVVAPNQIEDNPELIGWASADGNIGVNLINTGMQPHDFTLDLSATDLAPENQADYSFYVNSIFPKNVAGADVPLGPLEITESDISEGDGDGARDITFDGSLWMYPDDYELDDHRFKLRLTDGQPEPSLEIDEDGTIDAGTVNESRMVEMDVSVNESEQLSGEYDWSVTVGGEEAGFYDDGSLLTVYEGDGEHRIVFYAPDKDEPETYEVEVELETEDEELSDEKENLLSYSEPGGVSQTATALVLDTSGSMRLRDADGSRMSAAKQAARGVIDRQSDTDYVSVVGFDSGSNVRQSLTQLDEGRVDAELAVAFMNAGGSTNIGAGLSSGINEVLKAPEGMQKNIILMSDGGRTRGPSKSAMHRMVRNRMNPNGICLQTNSLGDGADVSFMNSLGDAADCSTNTQSNSHDEIVQDFIELSREFDASELVSEIEGRIAEGETFGGTFGVDNETTNVILDVARNVDEASGLRVESTENEIKVDDNIGDDTGARQNVSNISARSVRMETLNRPAPEERDVRLYKPDGSIVDPTKETDVVVSSTDERTLYRITDPDAGEWGYEIDSGEGGTGFEAHVTADSLTKMNVETSSDEYYTGTDAVLTATLFGAEPVRDANVEAKVEAPDGSLKTVTLEEVSPGVYRTTVGLEKSVSGTYEATVKAVQDEKNVERSTTVNWNAEFAAPVSVEQSKVPVMEPGTEGETEFVVKSEALLGIRSVEIGVSDFTHEASNTTIPGWRVSMNRSHLIQSGESPSVDATVSVPIGAPKGVYTAEATAKVDDSGTTVDKVELRVGNTECVNRRDAGRDEGDEICDGDRELGRGKNDGGDKHDTDRRDRGRDIRENDENGRRSGGR